MPVAKCFIDGCQWEQYRERAEDAAKLRERHEQLRHPDVYGAATNQPLAEEVHQLSNLDWRAQALDAIAQLSATGKTFTVFEVARYGVGEPPNPQTDWGRLTRDAHHLGLIEQCGFTESKRPGTRSSAVKLWRGTRKAG